MIKFDEMKPPQIPPERQKIEAIIQLGLDEGVDVTEAIDLLDAIDGDFDLEESDDDGGETPWTDQVQIISHCPCCYRQNPVEWF